MTHERHGLLAVMLVLLLGAAGCTTTLIPPDPPFQDPVTIHLLDHGRTSSLLLPGPDGRGAVRYAYGDWNWYALGNNGLLDGAAALLLPTRGAIGKEVLPAFPATETFKQRLKAAHVHTLTVERAAADRLRANLDRIFQENHQTLIANRDVGLDFVRHPRAYCAFHNSNHVLAGWLRELGIQTKGLRAFSDWAVRATPAPASSAQR